MKVPDEDQDNYDFVEKPSQEFYCPITFDLLREPYQTDCCGNHLSKEAVTNLQGSREPCPLCKKSVLETHPDKFFKRKVNDLQVRCPNEGKGCEWVGELGSLDQHLSKNMSEGDCQYVTMDCRYLCGVPFQRDQLKEHEATSCPNRPFTCEFCDHKATYNEVTGEHLRFCEKFPVECPNKSLGCQWSGTQGDIDGHLNYDSLAIEGECQFVLVDCPCDCYGEFQRGQLESHKANDCPNRPFTCRYCSYEATYTEVTNAHWAVCEKYPLPCPNKCEENGIERQDLEKHFQVCPRQIIECEFSYVGCELECERQHMQCHVAESMKTHLSIVSRVTKEQQDTIREHHQTFEAVFIEHQNAIKGQMTELETRIEEQGIKIEGLNRKFEEQSSRMKATAVEQYTRIEEQGAKIKEQESIITDQQCAVNQQQKQIQALISALSQVALVVPKPHTPVFIPPPDFMMTNFEERKKSNDLWYSCPFYSHIGGYKMCLRVNANGSGTGKGTHVSVAVQLMPGEHDDCLKRPFCGDITWQLLNQRRDEGHIEKTVNYDAVGDDVAGSPVVQEIGTLIRGYTKFISHAELSVGHQDKEYLTNDCLKFRVLTVVVKSY